MALFAYGFRPFFLLAGIYAVVAIAAWLWILSGGQIAGPGWPPHLWHGHEMLFGFIGAAVAGFLLTAVPSWTGRKGFAGLPLIVLTLIWLLGRVAPVVGGALPFGVLALVELLFLPALIIMIAPALLRETNRNTPLLLVLAGLWIANLGFLIAVNSGDFAAATTALRVGIDIVLLLITIIGGRITPSFTANALRKRNVEASFRAWPLLERLVIVAMLGIVVVDLISAGRAIAAPVIAVAAVTQGLRLARWHSLDTLREPIVWVLHAAYLWLPVGLALRVCELLGGYAWAAHWQHALGVGAAATMILAVMTRASLGHTGRPLVVGKPIVIAYLLLLLAVIVRVFGPVTLPLSYSTTVFLAGVFWMLAFTLYVVVYAPFLVRPRADNRPG